MGTGRDSDKFMLRLPDGLRDRIKEKADSNGRSMNAEIVQLLEREYPSEVFSAEEFVSYLQKLTGPMSLDEQIEKAEVLNATLRQLGVDLEAHLESGDIILMPRGSLDR